MKRPLVLHIGMTKTGSTSIQHVLESQRDALRAQGIYLPTSPGHANHCLVAAAVVTDQRRLSGFHPAMWDGMSPDGRLTKLRSEFVAEMSNLPDDVCKVIITAEQFSIMLTDPNDLQRLAVWLQRFFEPIQIIIYLRRQDQHAASAYSQLLRLGMLREAKLPQGGPQYNQEYDFSALLERWAGAFGQHSVTPRIFDRATLAGGDVVEDFCRTAGISLVGPIDEDARESNQSLSVPGQQLLFAAGRRMEARAPGTAWASTIPWFRLANAVSIAFPGSGWRPSPEEAREFMARFAETNERARKRFFPHSPSLFSEDFAVRSQEEATATVEDAALDILLQQIRANAEREARSAMALYRLNKRLDDRVAMRRCLLQAVRADPDLLPARLRMIDLLIEDEDLPQAGEHLTAAQRIALDDPAVQRMARRLQVAGKQKVDLSA